ncbi:nucleobase:cation symporter-2 family protein [Aeromonas sp. MdU4]|uniref:nucleobase:cation symporter-2 family protein n=1 Tax=Aeromonas sp. MdU4 TaxID=3342819 RepID=UPI0035B7A757
MNETKPLSTQSTPSPATTKKRSRRPDTAGINRIPPISQLFVLGLQHVLVMYAGAVAVPLVLGPSLGLPKDQVAYLISADLFCCGIVTLMQSFGIGRYLGIRLPVIMSVSFAAVTPMVAIGALPDVGLTGIFGATIASGLIALLAVPLIGKLMPLFPTVVTGVVITSIGISISQVGVNWIAGGVGNPQYGSLHYIGISFLVLLFILVLTRYSKGFISSISVLLGIIFGFVVAALCGDVSMAGLEEAEWFALILPFHFGLPTFEPVSIATLTVVMLITFIESMGMFLALGEMVERPATKRDITRGLRVDAIGTIFGGIFNCFPHTSFSQNIGLVGVTGVSSRWVCVMAGAIMIVLGLFPKLSIVVASVPPFVLGGAGIVMFGMVLSTGIRILSRADYTNRFNLFIIAVSLSIGMIPVCGGPSFFQHFPAELQPVLHSGILLSTISAVILNLCFNGYQSDVIQKTKPLITKVPTPEENKA